MEVTLLPEKTTGAKVLGLGRFYMAGRYNILRGVARNKLENVDQLLKLPLALKEPSAGMGSFDSSAATPAGKAEPVSRALTRVCLGFYPEPRF